MYFHADPKATGSGWLHETGVADSANGIDFDLAAPGPLPGTYYRVFQWKWDGAYYAVTVKGELRRSIDGLDWGEDNKSDKSTAFAEAAAAPAGKVRHAAVKLDGNVLTVFYTRVGDAPERIMMSTVRLTDDWMSWRLSTPTEVLKPEREYEGASLDVRPSESGASQGPEHALRDPAIYREGGRDFLLYSVKGELGIAIAELIDQDQPRDTSPPTVSITRPTDGASVAGLVNVAASGSDDVGVSKVEFLVDGVIKASDPAAPYEFAWATTTAGNGMHDLQAKAYDAAGNTASSGVVSVTVGNDTSSDTEAPTAPTDLVATATRPGQVELQWTASTDNVAVTGYQIVRDGTALTTVTSGTSYDDDTVSPGTVYTYTVKATDAAGNVSVASDASEVTTPGATGTGQPTFRSASRADSSSGSLGIATPAGTTAGDILVAALRQQSDSAPVTAPAGWTLIREDGKKAKSSLFYRVAGSDEPSSHDFVVGGKGNLEGHILRYDGVDTAKPVVASGAGTDSSGGAGTEVVAPSLTSSVANARYLAIWSARDVGLSVEPPRDMSERSDTSARATLATADRLLGAPGSSGAQTATVSASSDRLIGQAILLQPGSGGDVPTPDTEAPTAPSELQAEAASATKVDLRWTASTDDVGVSGYQVFRDGTQVATVTGTTYDDGEVSASTTYRYTVTAVDAAGNVSPVSDPAMAGTPAGGGGDTEAPSTPSNLQLGERAKRSITISWTASSDDVGVTGYDVLRDGAQVGTTTGTTFTDADVARDAAPTYTVSARDAAGNRSGESAPLVLDGDGGGGGGQGPRETGPKESGPKETGPKDSAPKGKSK